MVEEAEPKGANASSRCASTRRRWARRGPRSARTGRRSACGRRSQRAGGHKGRHHAVSLRHPCDVSGSLLRAPQSEPKWETQSVMSSYGPKWGSLTIASPWVRQPGWNRFSRWPRELSHPSSATRGAPSAPPAIEVLAEGAWVAEWNGHPRQGDAPHASVREVVAANDLVRLLLGGAREQDRLRQGVEPGALARPVDQAEHHLDLLRGREIGALAAGSRPRRRGSAGRDRSERMTLASIRRPAPGGERAPRASVPTQAVWAWEPTCGEVRVRCGPAGWR